MRLYRSFQRTEHMPIKFITLLAGLLILTIFVSDGGRVSAYTTAVNTPDLFSQHDPGAEQVAPEQDASLSNIDVTVNGESVTLVPTFDPDTTQYTATVNAERVFFSGSVTQPDAGIDQTSAGDETLVWDPPGAMVTTSADLTEGAITTASLRVLASDGVTTKTYHLFLSRPADPSVPDITIAANTTQYTAGLGPLTYTLTREGDTADSLDVTVNFTQEQPWLSDTALTATFAAGDAESIIVIVASGFSSSVTQSGELTATVAAVTGYDTSGAIVHTRVISQEGPAVTVQIEHSEYTFDEDAGTVDITLVARAHSSVPRVAAFGASVYTQAGQATSQNADDASDYETLSETPRFTPSDFQQEHGSLVGRKSVSLTIIDDDIYEGDELFHLHLGRAPSLSAEIVMLDPQDAECTDECPNPYPVTITDNDPAPAITIEADPSPYVAGHGNLVFTITRSGNVADDLELTVNLAQDHSWLSFSSFATTIHSNGTTVRYTVGGPAFSSAVTQSGELTASVAPVTGYDNSGASVRVRVISLDGPGVAVDLEPAEYTIDEDAGTLDITLVARAHSSISTVGAFSVNVLTQAGQATSQDDDNAADYQPLSEVVRFTTSDFQEENGSLVGRKSVSLTIIDDETYEGDEQLHITLGRTPGLASEIILLDRQGAECTDECPNPYPVTITDNDGPAVTVQFGQNAYTVVEGNSQDVTVALSDDPERTVTIPIAATEQDGATGADYSGVPKSVTFNTGETTQTISFTAALDATDDDGESVKLSFGSMLPAGVTEGAINETVVSLTNRKLDPLKKQPGLSIPVCEANGIVIFWHAATVFEDEPPPYGWRVERRRSSNGAWTTTRFDFLGAQSDALQTYSDEYWDWTDATRRSGVDYTYRVHALDNDGELMEGRTWSRRAPVLCP